MLSKLSLEVNHFSNMYVSLIYLWCTFRSNLLGTKFAIYDIQPPCNVAQTGKTSRRFYSRKVSPKVSCSTYNIAQVSYELNVLGTRGPRRMNCVMHSIPASSLEAG